MIEDRTGDDVAAEIKMLRTAAKRTILLVEGGDDSRFLAKFLGRSQCEVCVADGRPNALDALAALEAEGTDGIATIVDADYWHIEKKRPPSKNVLVTDYHDIEVLMVMSSAFDQLVAELGSGEKIKKFLADNGSQCLRTVLLSKCRPIALLRWLSHRQSLLLKFKGLDYKKLVDKSSLSVDQKILVRCVLALTANKSLTTAHVCRELAGLGSPSENLPDLCTGHDVTAIMAIGFRKALGSNRLADANQQKVEQMLRMAYDTTDLKGTKLYAQAKRWEKANRPFVLFAV